MLAGILGSLGGGTGSSDIHGADPWAERECGLRVTGTGPEVPQHRGSPLPLVWPRSGFCVEETWVCGEIARSAEAVAGAWGCLGRLGPLVSCQHVAWLSFSLSPAGLPLVTGYPAYDPHHAAFSQMVISFYYGGKLVGQATTTCPEGCRLALGPPGLPSAKLYGPEGLELVRFPPADTIPSERQRQVTRKLFGHLERGVLLHSSRQGVFVKRLCQGRVFCSGNAVVCKGRPNKLERDEVVQVFDTSQFFRELQQFYSSQSRLPDSRVVLCFGEEFPDLAPLRSKLILVQVEQLYVRQLVEDAGKSCGAGSVLPASEEPQPDQAFRMFPEICASHQRPFFRENQQITV